MFDRIFRCVSIAPLDTPVVPPVYCKTQTSFFDSCLREAIATGQLPHDTNSANLLLALQTLAAGLNSMSKVIHGEKKLWGVCEITLSGLGIKAAEND